MYVQACGRISELRHQDKTTLGRVSAHLVLSLALSISVALSGASPSQAKASKEAKPAIEELRTTTGYGLANHPTEQLPAGARCQTSPSQPSLLPPYQLAGEDVIEISVINHPMMNSRQTVSPEGTISANLLGSISVLGKTTQEVALILTDKWQKYIKNFSVTVTLVTRRKENVLVYGRVAKPGTIDFRQGIRLVEALAELGGDLPGADMAHVTLTRRNGEKQILDLSRKDTKNVVALELPLLAGDVIYVPELHAQVIALGEVGRPGAVEYRDNMKILDLIKDAGGAKMDARLSASTILRDGKEIPVDLDALLLQGDTTLNITLQPGDRLMIPENRSRIQVLGNIQKPGPYLLKENDKLLNAIQMCGGPGQNADLRRVHVTHINAEKNKGVVEIIDVTRMVTKGDLKGNILLQPGDVIFVPDKRRTFQLGDLFGVLAGLNLIDGVGRIFTKGVGN